MIWISGLAGIAAVGALLVAGVAIGMARRADDRCTALAGTLADALARIDESEADLDELHGQQRATTAQLDKLKLQLGRLDAQPGAHGFDEAIALTRHGADERELVDTCGLSLGEARLIEVLYGPRRTESEDSATDASEAH